MAFRPKTARDQHPDPGHAFYGPNYRTRDRGPSVGPETGMPAYGQDPDGVRGYLRSVYGARTSSRTGAMAAREPRRSRKSRRSR